MRLSHNGLLRFGDVWMSGVLLPDRQVAMCFGRMFRDESPQVLVCDESLYASHPSTHSRMRANYATHYNSMNLPTTWSCQCLIRPVLTPAGHALPAGVLMVGDQVMCSTTDHGSKCPVCNSTGYTKCEKCVGTGFRAKWLGDAMPGKQS